MDLGKLMQMRESSNVVDMIPQRPSLMEELLAPYTSMKRFWDDPKKLFERYDPRMGEDTAWPSPPPTTYSNNVLSPEPLAQSVRDYGLRQGYTNPQIHRLGPSRPNMTGLGALISRVQREDVKP